MAQVTFGRRRWQLPRCQQPHPDAAARAAAFAAALLAGHVLTAWQSLVPSLLDRPSSLAAAHARHVPRVAELLAALTAKRVGMHGQHLFASVAQTSFTPSFPCTLWPRRVQDQHDRPDDGA